MNILFEILAILILSSSSTFVAANGNELIFNNTLESNNDLLNSKHIEISTGNSNVDAQKSEDQDQDRDRDRDQDDQATTSLVYSLINREIRALKSTITDSVMEEVINYYGKKIEAADSFAKELSEVNKKVSYLGDNYNTLSQNYKQLVRNHRNLVDLVRNNLMSAKRERKQLMMMQTATTTTATTSTTAQSPSGDEKNRATSVLATILTDLLLNNNNNNNNQTRHNDVEALSLRNHLIYDLETKYSNLVNQNLLRSLLVASTNVSAANEETAANARALTANEIDYNDSSSRRRKQNSLSGNDTMRKIVIRNDGATKLSKRKNSSHHLRNHHQHHRFMNNSSTKKMVVEAKKQYIYPRDCQDLRDEGVERDGVYKLFNEKLNATFEVYCEFENDIGWLVWQRRNDGSVSFNQNWSSYKNGFGNVDNNGEFWLGLELLHLLTSQNNYSYVFKVTFI